MAGNYDVIVVGARCAGASVAMLLARAGQRVLLVDRAGFPSDTISTHLIHAPGVAALTRWGLAEQLAASGCPPIHQYRLNFGPFTIAGAPLPDPSGVAVAYSPRRTVLDKMLLDAAAKAGAEVREKVSVQELIVENGRVTGVRGRETGNGGALIAERAGLVIGADGRHSMVAEAVGSDRYREQPAGNVSYYAYWSDLPTSEWNVYMAPGRAVGMMPTHDGLTTVLVAAQIADMRDFRDDIEGNYLAEMRKLPGFDDWGSKATRVSRFSGTALPGFYRKPYGPGWALVGDAGYERDACTAQGITNAFQHAELLAEAWLSVQSGEQSFDEAMGGYQSTRDEQTLPAFDLACDLATLAPPPPGMATLLEKTAKSPQASREFLSAIAGTMPVNDFFSVENTSRIMAEVAQ
ncbi:NAD(P)/FAD-dependent oxidoreductase [Nonomuraea aridisoli]|uniref:Oxidoreductase n=1 Tax=Nonomuraea aridisoli TaxID=2070368 RepID=A0A2W2FEG2_9ACTN|nr:NAD(P)/FAD-dependent oxidoreductase [Nonomuraea aridisoli]PZG13854.1 oxidoreductase [Nonomuraea aridisoli]